MTATEYFSKALLGCFDEGWGPECVIEKAKERIEMCIESAQDFLSDWQSNRYKELEQKVLALSNAVPTKADPKILYWLHLASYESSKIEACLDIIQSLEQEVLTQPLCWAQDPNCKENKLPESYKEALATMAVHISNVYKHWVDLGTFEDTLAGQLDKQLNNH